MVGIVDVAEVLRRHLADFAPAVLDFPEFGEGILHFALFFHEGLEIFDDGLLLHQVFLAFGLLLAVVFRPFFLIGNIKRLEPGLDGGERALYRLGLRGNRLVLAFGGGLVNRSIQPGIRLFLGEALVESGFDGLRLLGALHFVDTFCQTLEQFREFGKGFLGQIDQDFLGFLFLLRYIWGFGDGDRFGFGHDYLRLQFFTHDKRVHLV